MFDIEKLKFDSRGLIPAVVTDAETGKVLMVAYMNRESLDISIREGYTCFFSRSSGARGRRAATSSASSR